MPRTTRVALAGVLAIVLTGMSERAATAAPMIVVTDSCAYSGGRLAVVGGGFQPHEPVTIEIMKTADPSAGSPLLARATTVGDSGRFSEILDVPVTSGPRAVMRSVRTRRSGDSAGGAPSLLATTQLRTVSRGVEVSGGAARASSTQRWRLTGLPDGTRLYAHYRHRGRTVASRFLGAAGDPCGRLNFELRTLPRGFGRAGGWELWMTADRVFRHPRKGVYVHRRLMVRGSGSRSRVRADPVKHRLAPLDARLMTPDAGNVLLGADTSQIGLISLRALPVTTPVRFYERVDDGLVGLGTGISGTDARLGDVPIATLKDATTWSCDRRDRYFVATTQPPVGDLVVATYSVHTPSCAARFKLRAPRRVAIGEIARVRISDRWALGAVAPSLCVTPPGGRRDCQRVKLATGIAIASRRFRANARGAWHVQLRVRDRRVAQTVVVVGKGATAAPAPTLLATGDSTMLGLDAFIGDELGDSASVVSDVRIATGISIPEPSGSPYPADPSAFPWGLWAREQTARLRQSTTVISLGGLEGPYAMTTPDGTRVPCCDAPWQAEYGRRVRVLMATYARGGRARVLWLRIPLPRSELRAPVTRIVNAVISAASAGMPTVKVLALDSFFTPDGYREVIRYRGRDVEVRDIDGVHLNVAGSAIAARLVAQALRKR